MSITEASTPSELGAGNARQGTTVRAPIRPGGRDHTRIRRIAPKPKVGVDAHKRGGTPVKAHQRRFPVRRLPVVESESSPAAATASYHTASVNAPLGYQGLFREN